MFHCRLSFIVLGVVTAATAGLTPAFAQSLDGRLLLAQGDVRIDGQPARAGQTFKGATISTGVDGQAQLRIADGTLIALPPASQIKLSAADQRQLSLVRGGRSCPPAWTAPGASILAIATSAATASCACRTALRAATRRRACTAVSRLARRCSSTWVAARCCAAAPSAGPAPPSGPKC